MAKILVIDDDPSIVLAVRLALESAGHEVVEASSGAAGLQKIKLERPDMLVLDVMMETQTEGFQLARRLREAGPDTYLAPFRSIPILMLTAIHSTSPLQSESDIDELPVDLFVDKPIDPQDLINKVDWVINREKV